jgi:hypothetical protein
MIGRGKSQNHPEELFGGGRLIFGGASGGDVKEGHAQLD